MSDRLITSRFLIMFRGIILMATTQWLLMGCETLTESSNPLLPVREGNLYGFINKYGDLIIPYQFAYALPFSEGLAAINIGGTPQGDDMPTDGKWGFIDPNGTIVINPVFTSPPNGALPYSESQLSSIMHDGYQFAHGLAAVYTEDNEWIYIDHNGMPQISDLNIQSARKFTQDSLAAVYINGRWGYVNYKGRLVIPPAYRFPVDFNEGLAMVVDDNYNLICINTQGNPQYERFRLASPFYDSIATISSKFRGQNASLRDQFKYALIDRSGNILFEPQFDQLGRFGNDLCPALVGGKPSRIIDYPRDVALTESSGGRWGFIDSTGRFVINPIYTDARGFREGLAAVKQGGDWGFINTKGNWVVQPGFRRVGYFENGLCLVTLGIRFNQYFDHIAYINDAGNVIWIKDKD